MLSQARTAGQQARAGAARGPVLPLLLAAVSLVSAHAALATLPATQSPGASDPRVTEFPILGAQLPRDPWPHSAGGVYFAMAGADQIVRFDAGSRTFRTWALPAGAKPHGVIVANDGTVIYAGFGDGTISQLDPRTGVVRPHRLATSNARPYSLVFDAQGNVWAALRAGGIAKLDRSTGQLTEYPMDGEPYGLAFDRNGMLWVTCIGNDKLRRFDPSTAAQTELSFDKGAKPRRLSIAADGTVWVSLYGSGQLAAVSSETGKVAKVYAMPGGANSGPYSVNAGPGGQVWVTEFQTDSIVILNPATGAFRVLRLPARSGVRNAAMDALGRYWFISSATGKIGLVE